MKQPARMTFADSRAIAFMLASPCFHDYALAVVVNVFRATGGNALGAAPLLGTTHRSVRRWCEAHPDLQRKLDEIRKERE